MTLENLLRIGKLKAHAADEREIARLLEAADVALQDAAVKGLSSGSRLDLAYGALMPMRGACSTRCVRGSTSADAAADGSPQESKGSRRSLAPRDRSQFVFAVPPTSSKFEILTSPSGKRATISSSAPIARMWERSVLMYLIADGRRDMQALLGRRLLR
jgi:hypothetical protein